MKKYFKFILYFGVLCFGLSISTSKILAANCNKTLVSGDTSSGVTCTYHTNSPDYCTASCASGWDTSCDSDEYISSTSEVRCYITDANCNNIARCYDCTELSCGSKTHLGDCPTWLGFEETNCTVTYPGGNPYTCCDCEQSTECNYSSDCNDGNDCTSDYCNTSTGVCSYTAITTGDCADEEPPDYDECEYPYCLDNGYHIADNCSGDCETENYWLNQEFYICCAPGYDYICDQWCYVDQVYGNCSYCNGPCRSENCPTTCQTRDSFVPDGSESNGVCKIKYCPATTPINGVCGSANDGTFLIAPTENLCSVGTASIVTTSGYTHYWTCSGNCTGTFENCIAFANSPPVFQNLVIKNNDSFVVPVESGNRNQICQTVFNRSRQVTFEVSVSDQDGITDIAIGGNVTLIWGDGVSVNKTIPIIGNIGATTVFGWSGSNTVPDDFININGIYPLKVTVTDSVGNTAVNTFRSFKFWDCKVPVSGTIYDSTVGGVSCPDIGFDNPADPVILNFSSLAFTGGGVGVSMTDINSPNYTNGTNYLTWGVNTYVASFNEDISLTNPTIRFKNSKSDSSWNCNTTSYIDTIGIVDPYDATSIGITADFSGTLIQDPWWQADGGGVISNDKVIGQVPVTCTDTNNCTSEISIDALVSAPTVSNDGKLSSYQNWYYSDTNNATLANYNTNYSYFFDQYFVKKGVGTTLASKTITSISDLGSDANNIYFINGDLTIEGNIVNSDDFLMIIVSGDITVDQSVTQVDGILVANNINATDSSDNQLVFNGSLYAANSVNFSRDYVDKLTNNSTPAVVVKYDPELIFNMPGDIAKILTNWQWGN